MRIIFVALVSILFSQPVFAWGVVPLKDCFHALERGVIIKNFSTGDGVYTVKKAHVHIFYNAKIYDFYYKTGLAYTKSELKRRAYCEVITFVNYD